MSSQSKGKAGEREICKILNKRFNTNSFSRVVGSGNRWAQVESVSKDYISDIVCPDGFRFSIECKIGYSKIKFTPAGAGGKCLKLDEFLDQSTKDANKTDKIPIVFWRQDRQKWFAFLPNQNIDLSKFTYYAIYENWIAVSLEDLLTLNDVFFFNINVE